MDCWGILGIAATADKREIKRAYAKLLKKNNPEEKPGEFQAIREAYDQALALSEYLQDNEGPGAELSGEPLPVRESTAHVQRTAREPALAMREKDKIRDLQVKTIDATLAKLIPLLRQDAAAAIEFCRATLKEDFYQALDARYEFEGRLILALLQNDLFSFEFLKYLALEFNWNIDIYRRGQIAIGHFDNDVRFSGAFYAVIHPYIAELIKLALREKLKSIYPKVAAEQLDRLETLLFADAEESELAEYCDRRQNRELLESAHNILTAGGFIGAYHSFVPRKTLQWLIDRKIVQPVEPKPDPAQVAEETASGWSGFPRWLIWIVVVIAFRLVLSIGKEFDSPQSRSSSNTSTSYALPREQADKMAALEREASQGNAEAQYSLGLEYLRGGLVLQRNTATAMDWLRRAADQQHAPARETLGILYYTGETGTQNYKIAIEMLTLAASQDRGDATLWLARAFEEGRGVEQDKDKARQLLERAIELGSSDAMRAKGMNLIYARGDAKDIGGGVEYLQKAIDKGNLSAAYQLAMEYLRGERLELNYGQAHKLLDAMSSKQIPLAQLWLSQLYDKGLGVPADSSRAKQLIANAKSRMSPTGVNDFAWSLVTHPNKSLRNGDLAVELMEDVLQNRSNGTAERLDTLAAAYAVTGNFDKAVQMQQRAMDALPTGVTAGQRRDFESRLTLYRNKRTYERP